MAGGAFVWPDDEASSRPLCLSLDETDDKDMKGWGCNPWRQSRRRRRRGGFGDEEASPNEANASLYSNTEGEAGALFEFPDRRVCLGCLCSKGIRRPGTMSVVVSSHVKESAVVAAPVEDVWRAIKDLSFSWWKLVAASAPKDGAPLSLGSTTSLTFKDGQKWTIALVEASEISRSITFEVLESEPALAVTSVVHTITLQKVTSTNQTFIVWSSDFSNDATAEVILDSKFKKLDAFNDLTATFS